MSDKSEGMPWTAIATGASGLFNSVASIFNANKQAKIAKYNAELEASTNKWITQANIDASKRLAEYQNSWNLAQWNRENQYNSPENQAKLYEAAGINKQAILGNINSNAASTPGAAGIMPDFSHGNGGAQKVAYQLPMFGDIMKDAINIGMAIEDLRAKRRENDIRDIDLYWANDDRRLKNLIAHQIYIQNGGEYKEGDSDKFRKSLLARAQDQIYQKDFTKAQLADYFTFNRPMLRYTLKNLINSWKSSNNDLRWFNASKQPLIDVSKMINPILLRGAKNITTNVTRLMNFADGVKRGVSDFFSK